MCLMRWQLYVWKSGPTTEAFNGQFNVLLQQIHFCIKKVKAVSKANSCCSIFFTFFSYECWLRVQMCCCIDGWYAWTALQHTIWGFQEAVKVTSIRGLSLCCVSFSNSMLKFTFLFKKQRVWRARRGYVFVPKKTLLFFCYAPTKRHRISGTVATNMATFFGPVIIESL